jgi:pyruvate dehydrogenase (quinone)
VELEVPGWASDADLDEIAAILNRSEAITIYAGAGCAGAHDEVVATAARSRTPPAWYRCTRT